MLEYGTSMHMLEYCTSMYCHILVTFRKLKYLDLCSNTYHQRGWVWGFGLIQYTILDLTMGKFRAQGVHQTGQQSSLRGTQHNAGLNPCKAAWREGHLPWAPPPWQLTGNNIAGRNAPRSQARWRKKTQMQTNFTCLCKLRRVAALWLCVPMYSAAGQRGHPNARYFALVSGQ